MYKLDFENILRSLDILETAYDLSDVVLHRETIRRIQHTVHNIKRMMVNQERQEADEHEQRRRENRKERWNSQPQ